MTTTTRTPLTLDAQLCVALYQASKAMASAYREGLAAIGLTYTQYLVLLALWEHEPMTMRDMSERLHLESATLSPLLRRMEGDGHVSRRRLPEDERVVEVVCTESGRALLEQAREVQQGVEDRTGLDDEELAALRGELQLLASRLRGDDAS